MYIGTFAVKDVVFDIFSHEEKDPTKNKAIIIRMVVFIG